MGQRTPRRRLRCGLTMTRSSPGLITRTTGCTSELKHASLLAQERLSYEAHAQSYYEQLVVCPREGLRALDALCQIPSATERRIARTTASEASGYRIAAYM